jgi:hypothetical protein
MGRNQGEILDVQREQAQGPRRGGREGRIHVKSPWFLHLAIAALRRNPSQALADWRQKDACCGRGANSARKTMHSDPRFWAVVAAFWIGFILAIVNIATKIDLFMRLSG